MLAGLKKALEGTGIVIPDDVYDQAPLYVPEDHFMIKQLKKVYEEVTGEEAKLISIGGGTYARAIDNAVALGSFCRAGRNLPTRRTNASILTI